MEITSGPSGCCGVAWAFRDDNDMWIGPYCFYEGPTTGSWVIVRRTGVQDITRRPIEAGPFATEEEAKAVLTAMHRMT